jgi:aldehyde dehydrogenase (NAD+)
MAEKMDVDRAVLAARRAFDRDGWPQTPPSERAALIRRLAALIETNADALGLAQVRENGKLLTEMRGTVVAMVAHAYFYAGLAETMHGYVPQSNVPGFSCYTRREAIGVVAAITPWNTPLLLLGWKLFPALAAGNTIVIKPSEVTPTSTLMLGRLIEQAGFPKGVVNIVTGDGRRTGEALVAHHGVDKVAFTGSTTTGTAIAKVAAERHARVSLELGGKSPNIFFDDIDLDTAVAGAATGIFGASGQACNAGSRVLVQSTIYDAFADKLAAHAKALRVGDPLDPATQFGPLASRAQFDKVTGYFQVARDEGIEVLAGGQKTDGPGFFVPATVLIGVSNESRIAREEIFGPIASLIRFDTEDEAIAIANDTPYGLAAGCWTSSLGRANRMIERLRSGTVWVNTYRMGSQNMPFGGFKASGVGREMGIRALDHYSEEKSVWINNMYKG